MPPSLNFPQLDLVKPSSGFHPVTWERVKTKAQFVANAVQVEMQRRHFYTAHHVAKATNAAVAYRVKHGIVDIDMG